MNYITKPIRIYTKIKDNDVLSLLNISFPLMLSCLSGSLMMMCDRFFIAQYSLNAFNSAISLGSLIIMLQIGVNICACTADVFVGKLNGANKNSELSLPIWQMIWFSIITNIIFIPLALYIPNFLPSNLINNQDSILYFRILMFFGFLSPLTCALSSFFVGTKNTFIPLLATVAGNLLNLILNMVLIFGFKEVIPAFGIVGASIATVMGQLFGVAILALYFFSGRNRYMFQTHKPKISYKLFMDILKLGYPNAIAQFMIAFAWSIFFMLMQTLGEASLTLASIIQTIFGFFTFIIQGLSRGMLTVVSNLIGERKFEDIKLSLFSGLKICFLFCFILSVLLICFPGLFIELIFSKNETYKILDYISSINMALFWGALSFLFKSIRSLFSGILTAAGHTKFIMKNEVFSIWIFFILPVWISINLFNVDVSWSYFIACLYNLIAVIFYYWKFEKIDWKTNLNLGH